VREAIDSVMQQTYKELEVVAVENNSTDNTWSVLKVEKEKHNEKLTILKELNPGAPAARNKGLNAATGKYIQFLDADDILLPQKIEHQVSLFERETGASFIASAYANQDLNGKRREKLIKADHLNNWWNLLYSELGRTSGNFWKKENLDEVEGWDESLSSTQEYDLMFRLLKNKNHIIVDNEVNTIRRERATGQISQSNSKVRFNNFFLLRQKVIEYLESNNPELFQKNKSTFDQALFDGLRILASSDLPKAKYYFKECFPSGYKPIVSEWTTPSYIKIYNIFGFSTTERIKRLIS
jgi:glycosyltransferase involved in cell wall biosynthesis